MRQGQYRLTLRPRPNLPPTPPKPVGLVELRWAHWNLTDGELRAERPERFAKRENHYDLPHRLFDAVCGACFFCRHSQHRYCNFLLGRREVAYCQASLEAAGGRGLKPKEKASIMSKLDGRNDANGSAKTAFTAMRRASSDVSTPAILAAACVSLA